MSPPKADFGFILGQAYWARGLATEAAQAVVKSSILQKAIFRIWGACHPANAASAAVLKKAGLHFETTLINWETAST